MIKDKDFSTGSLKTKFMVSGSNFIAAVGVLGFIGYWLDKKTGHEYQYFLIGTLTGVAWGFYETIKNIIYLIKNDQKNNKN